MIELTLGEFAMAVVGVSLFWVVGSMLFVWYSEARALRKALKQRVSCRLCGHVFEARSQEEFPKCPECGAANESR